MVFEYSFINSFEKMLDPLKVLKAKVWGVTVFMTYYGVCLNKIT